jgi:putative FmdB family regulatory protein
VGRVRGEVVVPIYEFTCGSCGLRFEKLYRRVSDDQVTPCESCGKEARRQVSVAAFKFNHPASQKRGMAPPNTGTSDDWNYDKAIGEDASRRHAEAAERRSRKEKIALDASRAEGKRYSMDHVVRDGRSEGGYRMMTEKERVATNTNRAIANAMNRTPKKEGS